MKTNEVSEILVRTIRMQAPIILDDSSTKRQAQISDEQVERLISFEETLRKTAYKNTTIHTDKSFFDDSDMKLEYYLVVVYDKKSMTPLLSARHYFDKTVISKYIKGNSDQKNELSFLDKKFTLENYPDGSVFLADRLSGNINSIIYRNYRNIIFLKYYSEILNNNRNCTILLMVRKEKGDKQLSKYLHLGFVILGSALHNGKEHHVILRNLKDV
jgi:hypothetical protein